MGVVERVGTEARRAFNDRDELWRILTAGKKRQRQTVTLGTKLAQGRKVIMKRAARSLLIVIGLILAAGGIFATDAVASDASLHLEIVWLGGSYPHDYELTVTDCSGSIVNFVGTGVFPAGPGPYIFTEVVIGSLNVGTGVLTFTSTYNEAAYWMTITGSGPASGPWVGGGYSSSGQTFDSIYLTLTAGAWGCGLPVAVSIDIKPGSDPNSINPRSKGVIPVAILTTETFDASTVDPTTVQFGPNGAAPVHAALEDVDGDTDLDLILHFRTQETGIACGDTEAVLTGETTGGQAIQGSDSVNTVGCP